MDGGIQGAVWGLAVIVAGVAVFLVYVQRRGSWIEAAGFRPGAEREEEIRSLAKTLLDNGAGEIHSRGSGRKAAWLLLLQPTETDDPGQLLWIHRLPEPLSPEVALLRNGRKIPRLLRRSMGGVYARLQPAAGPEPAAFAGTEWDVFTIPGSGVAPELVERLRQSIEIPERGALWGIALSGQYLAVWTSSGLRKLLAAGPKIRDRILSASSGARGSDPAIGHST